MNVNKMNNKKFSKEAKPKMKRCLAAACVYNFGNRKKIVSTQ